MCALQGLLDGERRSVASICCVSPLICFVIQTNSVRWLNGYKMGFELLMLNGLLTFIGLWLIRKPTAPATA